MGGYRYFLRGSKCGGVVLRLTWQEEAQDSDDEAIMRELDMMETDFEFVGRRGEMIMGEDEESLPATVSGLDTPDLDDQSELEVASMHSTPPARLRGVR